MNSLSMTLSALLISLATLAFAQTDAQKPALQESDAQKSFDTIKSLAGSWEGPVTTIPKM